MNNKKASILCTVCCHLRAWQKNTKEYAREIQNKRQVCGNSSKKCMERDVNGGCGVTGTLSQMINGLRQLLDENGSFQCEIVRFFNSEV